MAHTFLMIDGYNLMHAIGLARQRYGPGDLEVDRKRLLRQLASRLNPDAISRTIIVFDAFAADSDSDRQQTVHGLSVVYAPSGTDADSEIERLIAQHPSPRQLVVVSSDLRLHRAARRRHAQPLNSDTFWNALDSDLSHQPESPARPSHNKPNAKIVPTEFLDIDIPSDGPPDAPWFDADYLTDLEDELGSL